MPIPNNNPPLEADAFEMRDNPDAMKTGQANETFLLTAKNNGSLGTGAEKRAFAKYQYSEKGYLDSETHAMALASARDNAQRPAIRLNVAINRLELAQNNFQTLGQNEESSEARKEAEAKITGLKQSVQEKLEICVAALKSKLPEDQHAGVDEMARSPSNVAAALLDTTVELAAEAKVASGKQKELESLYYKNLTLFPEGTAPPDRGLLARAVASSQVDRLLGMNVTAEERFGTDSQKRPIGVSIQVDGVGITSSYTGSDGIERDCILDINLADPAIQRGLSDLETMDFITGQIDRHCGNMFIDRDTKQVMGIDNDLAFPEMSRQAMLNKHGDTKCVATMPRQIHAETARKLLAADPKELRTTLENLATPEGVTPLGKAAIKSACNRLEQLQAELRKPQGSQIELVNEFNEATYLAAVKVQNEAARAELDQDMADVSNIKELERVPLTSYLGAVEVEMKKMGLGIKQAPDQNGIRHLASANIVAREPVALAARVDQIQKELAELETKQRGYQARLLKLAHPVARDRLQAMAHGGVSGAKKFFGSKATAVKNEIDAKKVILDKLLKGAPVEIKDQLYEKTGRPRPQVAEQKSVTPAKEAVIAENKGPVQHRAAPAKLNQDNLADGPDKPKDPKKKMSAKDNEAAPSVHFPEGGQDLPAINDDDELAVDANVVEATPEIKQDLKKKPSVADILKGANSAPALGGHRLGQALGEDSPKPKANTLRASGSWQTAQPSPPKVGGGHSASHP